MIITCDNSSIKINVTMFIMVEGIRCDAYIVHTQINYSNNTCDINTYIAQNIYFSTKII